MPAGSEKPAEPIVYQTTICLRVHTRRQAGTLVSYHTVYHWSVMLLNDYQYPGCLKGVTKGAGASCKRLNVGPALPTSRCTSYSGA